MQRLSANMDTEALGLERFRSHGSVFDSFGVLRFVSGSGRIGHSLEVGADGVSPVVGDQDRLPSFVDLAELPRVSKTLLLPGLEDAPFSGSEPSRRIPFTPVKALAIAGASAAILALNCWRPKWGIAGNVKKGNWPQA